MVVRVVGHYSKATSIKYHARFEMMLSFAFPPFVFFVFVFVFWFELIGPSEEERERKKKEEESVKNGTTSYYT